MCDENLTRNVLLIVDVCQYLLFWLCCVFVCNVTSALVVVVVRSTLDVVKYVAAADDIVALVYDPSPILVETVLMSSPLVLLL